MKSYTVLVTGGIGSGKSAVCAHLEKCGVPVYYADARTKDLYRTDSRLVGALENALGVSLRNGDGDFCKSRLADVIFSDTECLSKVEAIVHPTVLRDFEAWKSGMTECEIVCMESAIALSKPLFRGCFDVSVEVVAPEELRISRVMSRDGLSETQVTSRVRNQSECKADYVIRNTGSLENLHIETDRIFDIIQNNLKVK